MEKFDNIHQQIVIKSKVTGKFEVLPDYLTNSVYFHPIPNAFQNKVQEGQTIKGYFGKIHETKKKDRTNKDIFIEYFIPILPNIDKEKEKRVHELNIWNKS